MAWRIDESVIRGEIDNREKGTVRGRIWLVHSDEPVVLELQGNAHADLAGCLLTFVNRFPPQSHPGIKKFNLQQTGSVGDITASRKVRVFTIPFEQAQAMLRRGENPPEQIANSLYLEWFSEQNGRVVIESADYKIEVSEPSWRLTTEEEEQRRKDAEAGWKRFAAQLSEAIEAQKHDQPDEIEEWDEFDFEKSLRESDALTDKYMELLDKYGDTPESEELIAREMGWDKEDEGLEAAGIDVEEMNRICEEAEELEPDPATEGVDWIRVTGEFGEDIRHPLQHRCFVSAMALWNICDELGREDSKDEDLQFLITEFQVTGAKLAGALNSLAYGRETQEPAFVVACLKRALGHLHNAQAGLEKVAPKELLPASVVEKTRNELFAIREEILRLMNEFRNGW